MPASRRDDGDNRQRRRRKPAAARKPSWKPPHITVTDTDAEDDWREVPVLEVADDEGSGVSGVSRSSEATDDGFVPRIEEEPHDQEDEEPSRDGQNPNEIREDDKVDDGVNTREEKEEKDDRDNETGRERDSAKYRGKRGSNDREERRDSVEDLSAREDSGDGEEMLLQSAAYSPRTSVPYQSQANSDSEWGFGHSRAASRAESAEDEIPEELDQPRRKHYRNVVAKVDSRRPSVSTGASSSLQDLSKPVENARPTRRSSLTSLAGPRPSSPLTQTKGRSRSRSASRLGLKKDDTGYETDWDTVGSRFSEARESWRARRVTFYKNGDPWFQGLPIRFVPGRDAASLETLSSKISNRLDLSSGVRYIFGTDGSRIRRIEELADGESYVASSTRQFQKAPYGMKSLDSRTQPETHDLTQRREKPRRHRVKPLSPVVKRVFGQARGKGSGGGSGSDSGGKGGGRRSGDNCTIKIINDIDTSIQSSVFLNLKTTMRFEDVLQDMGQVIKLKDASHMYTTWGQEVKSFSQLRSLNETDTFYLRAGERPRGAKQPHSSPSAPVEDKRLNKILRRHNSEPSLQIKERRSLGSKNRSESVSENNRSRSASDKSRIKVSLLGRVRTFYKPSKEIPVQYLPPDKRLRLDWVHGYRGYDSYHNLWVLPSGELLYYVAAVAVILNRYADTQRHYTEHSEDIMCMDLHPSKHIVASGQRAGSSARFASIRVWGCERLDTLHVFGSRELELGVAAVSFSVMNQGAYLLAVDAGEEHLLTVWTWHNEKILGKVAVLIGPDLQTHQDHVYGAKFHPMDNNLIITYGKHHLTFWNKRRDGIFDAVDVFGSSSARTILSVAFEAGGDLITGDADGYITTWTIDTEGKYYKRVDFEAHTSAVTSLLLLSEVTLLSGGEKDRRICAWDCSDRYIKRAETRLPEAAGGIRTLCPQGVSTSDGNVYAGTVRNMVLEGSIMRRFNTVVFGHSKQLWALAPCHDNDCYVTAGYDKLVVKWSDHHKVIWKSPVSSEAVSCAIHPLDTVVAVGSIDGYLFVYKLSDGALVGSFRVCGQPLSCLSYSPGGDMLAIGAQTGSVYPYKVGRDGLVYVKFGPMQGSQPLTHIDWSQDGESLQTISVDHELIFWNKRTMAKEKLGYGLRDKQWITQTCTAGYPLLGAWPDLHYDHQLGAWSDNYADSRKSKVLVTACRSRDHDLLAVGDSEGSVQLYRYPCPLNQREAAQCHTQKLQSSYVTGARFLRSNRFLVTVGGSDAALMQWRLQ